MSWPGAIVASIIGLVGSVLIWISQPFNDALLVNSPVAAGYMPVLCVAMVTTLTFLVNPVLRALAPNFSLSSSQFALIFGIYLVAGTAVYAISAWPHSLAHSRIEIEQSKTLRDTHESMKLPASLYPDPLENEETPVSRQLNDELEEDQQLPWGAWVKPGISWGSMLMFSIIMLIGLALIVYPQWRDNERLPFPLLTVQKSLFELESKGVFPDILRQKLFWTGAIIILIIHAFRGLHHHTGGAFPDFPVGWGFWGIFTGITRHMNWWVIQGGLIFAIVGITYFVPNRVSFSLWFTVAAYQVYRMVGFEYFAPFHAEPTVKDHRNGAVLGMAVVILWLGRKQWLAVAKAMFTPAKSDDDRRNRMAGLIFMIGACGLLGWQLWAGNSIFYALLAVVMTILTTLVLARIVAETGIPIIPNTVLAHNILQLFPIEWLTAKAIYLTNAMDMLLGPGGSRVSATIAAMHGFGLDQEAKGKNLSRRAIGFIVLIAVGIVICGAVHLYVGYHYSGPLNGRGASVGDYNAISEHMHNPIKDFVPVKSVDEGKRGRILWSSAPHNQILHTIIGFVMAVLLQIACLLSPLWPLHPAGLVIMDTSANDGGILKHIWPSILLGWVIKRCIVVYGGAKAYAYGKPLFLGIILGEVFSSIIWSAVPAILIWMGGDPAEVGHIKVGTR